MKNKTVIIFSLCSIVLTFMVFLLSENRKEEVSLGDTVECGEGQYIVSGKCFDCGNGTYCPDKKTYKYCPSGYNYSDKKATVITQCYLETNEGGGGKFVPYPTGKLEYCQPGTYSENKKVYYGSSSSCSLCPENTYGEFVGADSIKSCKACPAGTTSNRGSRTKSDCKTVVITKCGDGQYLKDNKCYDCGGGMYCPDGVKIVACPSGYNYSDSKATTITKCYLRTVDGGLGRFVPYPTASLQNCPAGTYTEDKKVYYGQSNTCTSCPAGTYSSIIGASSASTCTKCPSGTTSKAGSTSKSDCKSTAVTECNKGEYLSSGKCYTCEAGTYCPDGKKYYTCPDNTTSEKGAKAKTDCKEVPAKCKIGQYYVRGTCYDCGGGTYCPDGNNYKYCPSGYSYSDNKASTIVQCYLRTVDGGLGKFVPYPTSKLENCLPGTYTEDKKVYYGQSSTCTYCPEGTYNSYIGGSSLSACKACPSGTTSKAGSKSKEDCSIITSCKKGEYLKDNKCNKCEAGSYCPDGIQMISCPNNTTSNPGSTAKTDCNQMTQCGEGQYVVKGKCYDCGGGTYCPDGKTYQYCPRGYNYSDKKAKYITQCYLETVDGGMGGFVPYPTGKLENCLPGTYTEDKKVYYGQSSTCTKCPQNTYYQYSGGSSSSVCTNCPAGTVSPAGSTSKSDCKTVSITQCEKGEYLVKGKCYDCGNGTYCPDGINYRYCPSGYNYSDKKAVYITQCYLETIDGGLGNFVPYPTAKLEWCLPGTYAEDQKVYYGGSSTCKYCPAGTYNPMPGSNSITACTKCPDGTTSDAGALYKTDCYPVASKVEPKDCGVDGSYWSNSLGKCVSCPKGYPRSEHNSTSIKQCYISNNGTSYVPYPTGELTLCPAGTYCDGVKDIYYGDSSKCAKCPAGTYSSIIGASSVSTCVKCPKGMTSDEGSKSKDDCYSTVTRRDCGTSGSYWSYEEGKCVSCPNGYTKSDTNADSITKCYVVLNGYEVKKAKTAPTPCEAGSYQKNKKVYYGSTLTCSKCTGNTYSSEGAIKCEDCDGVVDTNHTKCEKVVPTPTCKSGEYLKDNKCEKCPEGYNYSLANSTSINQCYAILGGKEVKNDDYQITPCEPGTYQSYKRVYYGDKSTCSKCNGNTYSSAGALYCLPCDGEVDEQHTKCVPKDSIPVCVDGEYLDNNICATCPTGYPHSPDGATSISQCYVTINGQEITTEYYPPVNCAPGTYNDTVTVFYGGTSTCSKCTGNTYSNEGANKCLSCDGKVDANHTTCEQEELKCNNGEYLQDDTCLACPTGYDNTDPDATTKEECYTTIIGEEIVTAYTSPTKCQKGSYKGETKVYYGQTSLCTKCSDNKTTTVVGASSKDACNICRSGYIMNSSGKCVYNYQPPIDIEEDACYIIDKDGTYVFGKYKNYSGFTKVSDNNTECNRIILTKVDEDRKMIEGAKIIFRTFNDKMKIVDEKEYDIGKTIVEQLSLGTYGILESAAPSGYQLNDIETIVTIGLDGTINIDLQNNIELVSENYTRNIDLLIKNNKKSKDDDKPPQQELKCYVIYGDGKDNEYCYGTRDKCSGVETNKTVCEEVPLCYKKDDKSYVVGRFSNQDGFTYYGNVCPACYVNNNGEYHWTSTPSLDETRIMPNLNEDTCVTPKADVEYKCYKNKTGKYLWGEYKDNSEYSLIEDVLSESECNKLNKTTKNNIALYILIILISLLIITLGIKYYKDNHPKQDEEESEEDYTDYSEFN